MGKCKTCLHAVFQFLLDWQNGNCWACKLAEDKLNANKET